jgi:serine protease
VVQAQDPYQGLDRVPGEVLLDFRDELPNRQCFRLAESYGLTSPEMRSQQSDEENLVVARVPEGSTSLQAVAHLGKHFELESASPNWILRASYVPNDARFSEQWHMRQIHADDAWEITRGRGVVVAVIDTGVTFEKDPGNPEIRLLEDLENTAWTSGYDFVHKRVCAVDDHAHGNHVSGTIAQSTNNGKGVAGVAYEATIMPVKVLSAYGGGTMQQVHDGIKFAADHGADVINMSLGGGPSSEMMKKVCQYARDKGVVIVCAAGNESAPMVSFPAAYPACVAVSAVNSVKEKSFYSNWGDEIVVGAPGGDLEDHNGDGVPDGILQNTIEPGNPSNPGYYSFIGTSMASPHAAGVVALIKGMGVTAPDYTEALLGETATRLEQPEDENFFGSGLIDAKTAVDRIAFWFSLQKLLIGFLFFLLLKKIAPVRSGEGWCTFHVFGGLMGATGLFFLPYLGLWGFPLQDLICKGFPEWDLYFFGAGGHGNPLFYSAFLPLLLMLLLFSAPRPVRAFVAGFSLGVAAHLAWYALFPVANVYWVPDVLLRLGDQVWFFVHAGLALLAALAVRLGEER